MKPTSRRSLRFAWILLGLALLVWLSLEDQNPRAVLFFSLLVCSLASFSLAWHWHLADRPRPYRVILLGIAAGLAVVPVGLFLMALKTGLHSHPKPDFTPDQITWIVSRLPFWGLVGLLGGCSAFLWLLSRERRPKQSEQ